MGASREAPELVPRLTGHLAVRFRDPQRMAVLVEVRRLADEVQPARIPRRPEEPVELVVLELRDAAVREGWHKENVVAKAQVQSQTLRNLPVVLNERSQRVGFEIFAILISEAAA